MIVRVFATLCLVGIAGVGVHMMSAPSFYDHWAAVDHRDSGKSRVFTDFAQSVVHTLGGINSGRVLTVMSSFLIAGVWIPQLKKKNTDTIHSPQTIARGDEKILLGEITEEPAYEYKI